MERSSSRDANVIIIATIISITAISFYIDVFIINCGALKYSFNKHWL
jgi:hypothetical protein